MDYPHDNGVDGWKMMEGARDWDGNTFFQGGFEAAATTRGSIWRMTCHKTPAGSRSENGEAAPGGQPCAAEDNVANIMS
ncbi:dNA gyrase subunit A [Anopheles sinensis]|uniref:DNA gyrase subunit A n=1 Tax=Anopheles sinensis TaxID=74873 RepID=A0A084VYZ7_ANOSI|nr:dNA gyrase subunit A [Anopheles sinensis]